MRVLPRGSTRPHSARAGSLTRRGTGAASINSMPNHRPSPRSISIARATLPMKSRRSQALSAAMGHAGLRSRTFQTVTFCFAGRVWPFVGLLRPFGDFSSSGLDKNVYVCTFAGRESKHAFAGSQIDLRCRQCRGLSLRCPVRAAGVFVRGRSGERAGFRASAADALPILQRLGLAAEGWLWGIESFGRVFRSAIGRAAALTDFAASRGRRWLHGISAARLIFG